MPDSELLRCIEKRELVAMAMALAAPATQAAGEFATPQSCNRALRAARALLQLGAYRTQRTHMYVCVRDACEVKQAVGEFATSLLHITIYSRIYIYTTHKQQQ